MRIKDVGVDKKHKTFYFIVFVFEIKIKKLLCISQFHTILFESSTLASMDAHKVKNEEPAKKKGVSHKKKKLMQVLVSVQSLLSYLIVPRDFWRNYQRDGFQGLKGILCILWQSYSQYICFYGQCRKPLSSPFHPSFLAFIYILYGQYLQRLFGRHTTLLSRDGPPTRTN